MKHLVTIALLLAWALPCSGQFSPPVMTPPAERSDSLRSFEDDFSALDTDRWVEVTGGGSSDCSVSSSILTCTSASSNEGAALWVSKLLPIDEDWTFAVQVEHPAPNVPWYVWLLDQPIGSEAIMTSAADAAFRISAVNGNANVALEYYPTGGGSRLDWEGSAWGTTPPTTSVVNWPSDRRRTFLIVNDGANEEFTAAIVGETLPHTETNLGIGMQTWTSAVAWSAVIGTGTDPRIVIGIADDIAFASSAIFHWAKLNIGGGRKWGLVNGKDDIADGWCVYWVQAYGGDHEDGLLWMPSGRTPACDIAIGSGGSWNDVHSKDKSLAQAPAAATRNYYIALAGNDGTDWEIGFYWTDTLGGTITESASNPRIPTGGGGGEPVVGDGGCYAPYLYYDNVDSRWVLLATCLDAGGLADVHWWTNTDDDPDTASWTYQAEIISTGTGGSWDDNFVSNAVVTWDGAQYHVLYAGQDGSTWGWGLASGTTFGGLSKSGSNPIQPTQDETSESVTGGTNIVDVTVSASSAYPVGGSVVLFDGGANDTVIRNRVLSKPDGTTVRMESHFTLTGTITLSEYGAYSTTIHGLYDTQRLLDSERFVYYETCFPQGVTAYNEMLCHSLGSALSSQPTFDSGAMVLAGSALPPSGFNSWENLSLVNLRKR